MGLLKHRGVQMGLACLMLALALSVGNLLLRAAEPVDVAGRVAAGQDALQRARETGDPTYYSKAAAAFAEALRAEPRNADALMGQGQLALARHQFRAALELGRQATALQPKRQILYGVLGDAQVELGMYTEAAVTMQRMIDMRPDLNSYTRASYIRELYGDVDGAIELMTQAVTSGGPRAENRGWVIVQLGNLYFNKGDLADAEQQYQQALGQFPGYTYALAGLAHVRAAQGRYAEARDLYNQAIAKVPLPEFVIGLGETEQAAGRPAEAQKQYDLVRVMEKLFQANGVNTDLELALFEADHGDPKLALAGAQTAYKDRPSLKAADTLAWALSQAGDQAAARQRSQEALRLGTKDALLFYHAGMIAYRSGDQAAARQWLQQALGINPYFSVLYAQQARDTLAQATAH